METYRVYEVVLSALAYEVKAESEEESRQKLEDSCWSETEDIIRTPRYDKTVDRTTESTGIVGEPGEPEGLPIGSGG